MILAAAVAVAGSVGCHVSLIAQSIDTYLLRSNCEAKIYWGAVRPTIIRPLGDGANVLPNIEITDSGEYMTVGRVSRKGDDTTPNNALVFTVVPILGGK